MFASIAQWLVRLPSKQRMQVRFLLLAQKKFNEKNWLFQKLFVYLHCERNTNMNGKNTIEELHKNGLIYLVFVSLISSDTLLGLDDCENSLNILTKYNEELKNANIDAESKQKYQKFINDAFEIVNRDLKSFKNKMETNSK